jgi:hypothetical protein
MEHERRMLAAVVEVADGHPHRRADAHEPEQHDGEEAAIPQCQEVAALGSRVERVEKLARLRAIEHRGFSFSDDEARGTHRERRVVREHSALRQVVEPVPKRRSRELHARL